MKNLTTTVVGNREVAPGYWRMRVMAPDFKAQAQPGQFVMLRVRKGTVPFLRRPFGIFDIGQLPPENGHAEPPDYLELLYRVVGEGTALMAGLREGDPVEVLGPLGNGFNLHIPEGDVVLVAGGVGVAPLLTTARAFAASHNVELLLGGKTHNDILAVEDFKAAHVPVRVSTEDGSEGVRGLVTQLLAGRLREGRPALVAACGPMPMLRAVRDMCREAQVPLQVSLESLMGCGVGACLGCMVKGAAHTEEHPQLLSVCKDGLVFDGDALAW